MNQAYGAATALNTYPSVGGQALTYWPTGTLYSRGSQRQCYDELGNLRFTDFPGATNTIFNRVDPMGERRWSDS